ncbi:1-acyl-sn-glycerol-3-phosphate acyltransferase, partial [Petrachloros mirabilis]
LPGGEKIWPERVEEALDEAASIREAGVFSRNGHLVAIIVPSALSTVAEARDSVTQSIRADVGARLRLLPSYCRLTDFVLSLDPLPRTRLGKIQRHKLKELFETGKQRGEMDAGEAHPISVEMMTPEDRQLLEDPVAMDTWKWMSQRYSTVRLTPDTNMWLELGLDSLEWMTMTWELRDRIGVDVHEEMITRISTVRDLLREVVEAEQAKGPRIDPLTQLAKPEELLDPYQRHWLSARGLFLQRLGSVLLSIAGRLMRMLFTFEVRGLDRIPGHGPWVMTPNHLSLLDPAAIIAALPASLLQDLCWGGWTGIMFRNPIMRLVSRATSVLPVEQSGPPVSNLALGVAALARGNNLIWFPEGNRSPDGTLQTFQPGIGLILTAYPVPVIPVRIAGTFEALPRGSWWPRRGRVTVSFGRAVEPDELAGDTKGPDRYRRIALALERMVAALDESIGSAS